MWKRTREHNSSHEKTIKQKYLPHRDMNMAKNTVAPLSHILPALACEQASLSFQYGHQVSHKGHMVILLRGSHSSLL